MVLVVIPARIAQPQSQPAPIASTGTVTVQASDSYQAGGLHTFFLGENYRDLWGTEIGVPVLDLRTFGGGGIRPTKAGGGRQTRSLRFIAPDSSDFVFRPVYKTVSGFPDHFDGTIVTDIFRDQGSASHPAATVSAAPMLEAIGVLHPTPRLVVMPDDALLGEFRQEFAGLLGTIETYPETAERAREFSGAVEIIDSKELLERLNRGPVDQVDTHLLLTARLVDMLIGDNDRHPGQWKWARLRQDAAWVPISRDRDKVFISYEGFGLKLARMAVPSLVTFDSRISDGKALFNNAIEFDRRLFGGLEKAVWDSVARSVQRSITNSVIDASLGAMPPEYSASFSALAATLHARRDDLPRAAADYYADLSKVADIHATDADDRAIVSRSSDGYVDVVIQSGGRARWFARRFDPNETGEIRIHLHGGNDSATITGDAPSSIKVRIIGGNGTNTLVDRSTGGGRSDTARLHENGNLEGAKYAPDSVAEKASESEALNRSFNRRPWVFAYGELIPPQRDRGTSIGPTFGIKTGHGLGLVPRIGLARYQYGFRKVPYASMIKADLAYSTGVGGVEIRVEGDKRFESSALHALAEARMSQIEVGEFRGFGNDVPNARGDFYDVGQTQWFFNSAAGLSFGPESDVSLGPIVRYTRTDSTDNFISEERPYGFGSFGQVGLRLKLYHDTRDPSASGSIGRGISLEAAENPSVWGTLDMTGSVYPGVWDAESAYEEVSAVGSAYLTMPVFTRPVLAVRAGGKKLFGDFPYFDAAFVGGSSSLRTEHRQRYAGDASIFGTTELRVPISQFPFILPLDVGALGFVDVARVYLDGESPGGWHTGAGAGFWVGVFHSANNVNVTLTNNSDRRVLVNLGFAF